MTKITDGTKAVLIAPLPFPGSPNSRSCQSTLRLGLVRQNASYQPTHGLWTAKFLPGYPDGAVEGGQLGGRKSGVHGHRLHPGPPPPSFFHFLAPVIDIGCCGRR
jgi:hypothetical protein